MTTTKPTVRYVHWIDSQTTYGWNKPDMDGPSQIQSVGVLVGEDKQTVVLSTSVSGGGRYVDQIAIPRSCIVSMKTVRL